MCTHSFQPSNKPGYVVCSLCGTHYSHSHGNPVELYSNDYWSHESGHSTIQEQVFNVTQAFGDASEGKNDKLMLFVPPRGSAVLEIACAPGDLLKRLGERFETVYGVEVDPRYEAELRRVCGPKSILMFGLFPVATEHLPAATLDCLIGLDVFEHVPDGDAFISECLRLLKPGGTLVLMSPFVYSDNVFDEKMFHPAEHVWIYTETWLKETFSEGFQAFRFDRWLPGHEVFACVKKGSDGSSLFRGPSIDEETSQSVNKPMASPLVGDHPKVDRLLSSNWSDGPSCPVCNGSTSSAVMKKGHLYYSCNKCRAVFTPAIDPLVLRTENEGGGARNNDSLDALRLERIEFGLGFRPPKMIDLGCGGGQFVEFLTQNGIEAYGVDRHTKLQLDHLEVEGWDAVSMIEVIEHLFQPNETFKEISRILKPGGILYIESSFVTDQELLSWDYLDPCIGHCLVHSPESLALLAERNQFGLSKFNNNTYLLKKALNPNDLVASKPRIECQALISPTGLDPSRALPAMHQPYPVKAPEALLYEPNWTNGQWGEVVITYLEAFSVGEAVALILPLDSTKSYAISIEKAETIILEFILHIGREQFPEIILVDKSEELLGVLRKYKQFQWVPENTARIEDMVLESGVRYLQTRNRLTGKDVFKV